MQSANSDQFEALLEASGLTKQALSDRLGIHPTTISRWESVPRYAVAYLELYMKVKEVLK